MEKRAKRILSLVLIFSLFMSLLSISAYAEDGAGTVQLPLNQQQVKNAGETITSEDGLVTISKTLEGTDVENVFDITLTVETGEDVQKLAEVQPAAVVLVMDVSYSMVDFGNRVTAPTGGEETQWAMAERAAEAFIDTFAQDAAENPEAARKLAVVSFNTDARTVAGWTDCKADTAASALKTAIEEEANEVFGDADNGTADCRNGKYTTKCDYYQSMSPIYTNIEGGLKLADNLLQQDDVDGMNKYIILLTDGFPTTYIKSGDSSTTEIKGWNPRMDASDAIADASAERGYFYDDLTGAVCRYGTSYSDTGAKFTQEMAAAVKENDASVFTIGINIGGQNISEYQRHGFAENAYFSVVECYAAGNAGHDAAYTPEYTEKGYINPETISADFDANYVIGKCGNSVGESYYKTWLSQKISSEADLYWDGDDAAGLQNAFNKILEEIEIMNRNSIEASWVAADPMTTDVDGKIEFLKFYDKGVLVDGDLDIENGNENTASLDSVRNIDTITWDLKTSERVNIGTEADPIYKYTLKYRVRLKNEAEAFEETTVYDTNGVTSLKYKENKNGTLGEMESIEFPIPAVEGYLGELVFTKTAYGEPLNGAEFTLTHDEDCSVCAAIGRGENVDIADMVQVSDGFVREELPGTEGDIPAYVEKETGKVIFSAIPSGHVYTLKETTAPDGFLKSEDAYRVTVAYDAVIIEKITEDESGAPVYTLVDKENLEIANTLKLQLEANKVLNGAELRAEQFSFELLAEDKEIVLQTVKNDADGNIRFDILLDKYADTYTFYIREVNDDQFGIVYDGTVYKAVASRYPAQDGTGCYFDVEYSKDGADVPADGAETAPAEIKAEFENEYLEPVSLTVKKVWEDRDDRYNARPESIFVQLMKNGEAYNAEGNIARIVELKAEPVQNEAAPAAEEAAEIQADDIGYGWTYTWTGLDATEEWTVKELIVPNGYRVSYSTEADTGAAVITNTKTFKVEPSYIFCTVKKVWEDDNDAAGVRPESVTVQLLKDGKTYGSKVVLSEKNGWGYTWTDLPDDCTYEVVETAVAEGYTSSVSGSGYAYTITNTYTPVTPPDPPVEVEEKDPPKDGKDPLHNLDEGDVPQDYMEVGDPDIPKTSDSMGFALWITIAVLSALALLKLKLEERKTE